MGNTSTVRAVETAGEIIDALAHHDGTATIAELNEDLPLAKSTIYKHLDTLRGMGLVVRSGDSYRFGLRFLEIGDTAREYDGVYEIAKPEVRRMAEETGEVANLVFEEDGLARYVYTAAGDQAVDLNIHVGKRVALHSTGLGKALLASLDDSGLADILSGRELQAHTDQTITDRDELRSEIESIRENGVAYDVGEHTRGMGCVAAAIQVPGTRHASISVTGPVSRVTTDRTRTEYTQVVRRVANVIELNLSSE